MVMRQNYDSARSSSLSLFLPRAFSPSSPSAPAFRRNATTTSSLPHYRRAFNEFSDRQHRPTKPRHFKIVYRARASRPKFLSKGHRRTKERKIAGKGRKERRMLPISYGLTSEYHEFRYFSLASKRSKPLNGIFKGILFLFRRVNEVASHRWGKAANERGRASFHLPLSLSVSVLVFSTRGGPGLRRMRRASGTAANFNI